MFFSILSVSCRRNPPVDGNFRILKWRYRFHIFGLFLRPNFREYHHKIWPTIWYERTSILGSWRSPIDIYIFIYIYMYTYSFYRDFFRDAPIRWPPEIPIEFTRCHLLAVLHSLRALLRDLRCRKAELDQGAERRGSVPRVKDVVKWWRYHRT